MTDDLPQWINMDALPYHGGGIMSRRSYGGLMSQPAWALYDGVRLIATVRAAKAEEARDLFKRYGMHGDRVGRVRCGCATSAECRDQTDTLARVCRIKRGLPMADYQPASTYLPDEPR